MSLVRGLRESRVYPEIQATQATQATQDHKDCKDHRDHKDLQDYPACPVMLATQAYLESLVFQDQ